jgi:hypothetical protein
MFSHGWESNNWRSVTFESLMAGILYDDSGASATLRAIFDNNIKACGDKITAVLSQAMQRTPSQTVAGLVQKLCRSAAELGLQFGVQPSRLVIFQPAFRQTVEIGKEVVDCVDADIHRGRKVKVGIVVTPGLRRVGDGKRDFQSDILLASCSIYPLSY